MWGPTEVKIWDQMQTTTRWQLHVFLKMSKMLQFHSWNSWQDFEVKEPRDDEGKDHAGE